MLNVVRTIGFAAVCIAAGAIVVLVIINSPSYEECTTRTYQEQSIQPEDQESPYLAVMKVNFRCAGEYLDRNNAVVTALATAVIALFTFVLVLVINQQARLTKASVKIAERALTELEAPRVFVQINTPGLKVVDGVPPQGKGVGFGNLQWCVVNYGRTPAMILEIFSDIQIIPFEEYPSVVKPRRDQGDDLPYGVFAPPNGGQSHDFPAIPMQAAFTQTGPPGQPFTTHSPFFLGFVRYSDIFGNRFILGFCFMFEGKSNAWIRIHGDEYNYCRKE
jgi:hypothetical protein